MTAIAIEETLGIRAAEIKKAALISITTTTANTAIASSK